MQNWADIDPETTPPDSDNGLNCDEKSNGVPIGIAHGMHSRQASFKSMRSTVSTSSRPRTYFTHGGRVTVEDGDLLPSQRNAGVSEKQAPVEAAPSIKSEGGKRKSRFLSFGRKS